MNYFRVRRDSNDSDVFDTRIDHNFNDRHRVFGRYSFRDNVVAFGGELPFPAGSSLTSIYRGHRWLSITVPAWVPGVTISFDSASPVAKPTFIGNLLDESRDVLDIEFDRWFIGRI